MSDERPASIRQVIWPKLTTRASARAYARAGAVPSIIGIVGLVVVVLLAGPQIVPGAWPALLFDGGLAIVVCVLTWRVFMRRGFFSSIALLLLSIARLPLQFREGTLSPLAIAFWAIGVMLLVNSVRAHWKLRRGLFPDDPAPG